MLTGIKDLADGFSSPATDNGKSKQPDHGEQIMSFQSIKHGAAGLWIALRNTDISAGVQFPWPFVFYRSNKSHAVLVVEFLGPPLRSLCPLL